MVFNEKFNNIYKCRKIEKLHISYVNCCREHTKLVKLRKIREGAIKFKNPCQYPNKQLEADIKETLKKIKKFFELLGLQEEIIKKVCHPSNYHNFEALGFFD